MKILQDPYVGAAAPTVAISPNERSALSAREMLPDAVALYEDSLTGNEDIQKAALREAALRASDPSAPNLIPPPEQTARQRLGLDP